MSNIKWRFGRGFLQQNMEYQHGSLIMKILGTFLGTIFAIGLTAVVLTLCINLLVNKKQKGLKNLLFEPISVLNIFALLLSTVILFRI